jgi:hypothetical protein
MIILLFIFQNDIPFIIICVITTTLITFFIY